MNSSLLRLSKKFNKDTLPKVADRVVKETALSLLNKLVWWTPVDTSKALSNWQISIAEKVTSDIPSYRAGSHGSTRVASIFAAVGVAQRNLKKRKPGQVINVSNVVDYIEDLNRGTSPQRDAGWVNEAILAVKQDVKNIKVSLLT